VNLKIVGTIAILLVSVITLGCVESSSPDSSGLPQNAVTPTQTSTSIITSTPTPAVPTSTATPTDGGRNILIIIDVSGSTIIGDLNPVTGEVTNTAIEQEDAIAANIAGAMTPDSNVGVIGFGGKVVTLPFMQMTAANKNKIKQNILSFMPTTGANPTNLNDALKAADDAMKKVTGAKEVIVLSDGKIGEGSAMLNDAINAAKTLSENGVTMTFIQVRSNENQLITDYKKLADSVGGRIIAAPIGYTGVDKILEQPSATSTPTPMV
jgi:Ca-activated chloride channel family protein